MGVLKQWEASMRWLLVLCVVACLGCDDEGFPDALYADGTPWRSVMPASPGSIIPRDMTLRDWDRHFAQNGFQADSRVKTFTPTWTGFSAAPSGDLSYYDFGKIVNLSWDGAVELVGTSNTNAMTITNLPSGIWPTQTRWLKCLVVNNDFTTEGSVSISTAGVLTFYFHQVAPVVGAVDGLIPQATGFNTANNKGVPAGWIIEYVR